MRLLTILKFTPTYYDIVPKHLRNKHQHNYTHPTLSILLFLETLYTVTNAVHLHTLAKKTLFTTYCKNIYCCHVWVNFKVNIMNKLKVVYNNVWRRLLGGSPICSASTIIVQNHVMSLGEVIHHNVYSLKCRFDTSSNV